MSVSANRGAGSLVKSAIDAVKGHIRENGLHVGDLLPGEGFFAEQLGVSRAVMREAFGALAALRLIEVANGRRARVGALDGTIIADSLDHAISTSQISVADVWEVRRTIEVETAALAARNATPEQATQIVKLAAQMALDPEDGPPAPDKDIALHLAIAEACGNPLFLQIVVSFAPLMRVAVPTAWKTRQTREERDNIIELHCNLAAAIAKGDADEARRHMEAHFDETIGALLRTPSEPTRSGR